MSRFVGVERVDPERLAAQHALTKALWGKLCENGLRTGDEGGIECFVLAPDSTSAENLTGQFSGWHSEVMPAADGGGGLTVKIVTATSRLTETAFLELLEVVMIAAVDTNCEFDGFQVNLAATRRSRPWWRFW